MSEAKLRELRRLFQIIKNSLSHFSAKNNSPLKDGAEAQLNSILYRRDRACPCPQQITYKIKSTDSRKDSRYISANSLGGSKPPPYTGKVNLMLTATTQYCAKSTKIKGCNRIRGRRLILYPLREYPA